MKIILAIVLALVLAIGGGSYYKSQQAKRKAQEAAEQVAREAASKKASEEAAAKSEIDEAKQAEQRVIDLAIADIKAMLTDPQSAQFRVTKVKMDFEFAGEKQNVVCGSVNAKNKFGGYVGFKQFAWQSTVGRVSMEPEHSGFIQTICSF